MTDWDLIKSEPLPISKVERPSEFTPNPPTAFTQTTPEKPETLSAQIGQLSNGARRVVMLPKGSPMPTAFPMGSSITNDGMGNVYLFRPDLISRSEIKSAAKNNKLNEILGSATMGMGAPDKSQIPENSPAVVARDANGVEIQSTLTPESTINNAMAAAQSLAPPGGSVSVEPPKRVINSRINPWQLIRSEPLKEQIRDLAPPTPY